MPRGFAGVRASLTRLQGYISFVCWKVLNCPPSEKGCPQNCGYPCNDTIQPEMASFSTGASADRNTAKRLPSRIIGVSKKRQLNNDSAIAIPMH